MCFIESFKIPHLPIEPWAPCGCGHNFGAPWNSRFHAHGVPWSSTEFHETTRRPMRLHQETATNVHTPRTPLFARTPQPWWRLRKLHMTSTCHPGDLRDLGAPWSSEVHEMRHSNSTNSMGTKPKVCKPAQKDTGKSAAASAWRTQTWTTAMKAQRDRGSPPRSPVQLRSFTELGVPWNTAHRPWSYMKIDLGVPATPWSSMELDLGVEFHTELGVPR